MKSFIYSHYRSNCNITKRLHEKSREQDLGTEVGGERGLSPAKRMAVSSQQVTYRKRVG